MTSEHPEPLRLAIVNDYEIVVAGLAAMLGAYADRVHVVELDAQLPVVSDVDLVLVDTFGRVHATDTGFRDLVRGASAKVVVFSWDLAPHRVDQAIAAGAAGYLSKAATAQQVVAALEAVLAGRVVVLTGAPDEGPVALGEWPGQADGLTPREAEILSFITQGLSNKEIAERAYLSINSVKTHIRSAYRKIGATRRAQAVSWGVQNGLEPGPARILEPSRGAVRR